MRLQTKEQRKQAREASIKLYVDKHDAKVQKVYNLVIVTFENPGHFSLLVFKENAAHAFIHYWYRTDEQRQQAVNNCIDSAEKKISYKADRKQKRKAATTAADVKVGELFSTSWGYDQTNVDFYQIVRVQGCFAWLQEIGTKHVEGSAGFMSEQVVPDVDNKIGEPVRKKICANLYRGEASISFKMRSWGCYATKTSIGQEHYHSWYG